MLSLARLSVRRPKGSLAVWLVIATALSLVGFGVAKSVSPSITVVPGTQSSRAQQLAEAQFGPTQLIPVLLEGPKDQLDRQGPRLVVALMKRPHTRVLSAWDAGTASAGLRPKPTAAVIVISVDRPEKEVVKHDQPQLESLIASTVRAPVKPFITGQPSLDRAVKDASLSSLRRTELIAIGVLFVLLLLGLRAPVAALIVTGVGAISTLAGFGVVALLGRVLNIDPLGVALGTMTGLALGVGFALLILDRFHREGLPEGRPPRDAAGSAITDLETTGRAVLISGTGLVLALAVVAALGPTELLVSLGAGMLTCAAFATGGAVVVMPAALVLLGRRLDAFSFPAPSFLARAWSRMLDGGNWVTRHAAFAGLLATAVLAVIAVPALALKSGPPDISQLPGDAKARVAFEEVSRVMGPGWATPYNLIVVGRKGPITDPAMLTSLEALQGQIAADKTVDTVTGPGAISSTSAQLKKFWPGIQKSAKISERSKHDLLKLIDGLGQAGAGSAQLQSGLAQASSGASQAHGGSGQAQSGAGQLHAGLVQARAGSVTLSNGLDQALTGAQDLKTGAGQALSGSQTLKNGANSALGGAQALKSGASQLLAGSTQLASGLGQAAGPVRTGLPAVQTMADASAATVNAINHLKGQSASAQDELSTAIGSLQSMTAGRSDPKYADVAAALTRAQGATGAVTSGLEGAAKDAGTSAFLAAEVNGQIKQLSPGLDTLHKGAIQLQGGIQQLLMGNSKLAGGIEQLSTGLGQLTNGNGQLAGGLGQLSSGLGQLSGGGGQLKTGLGQLTNGALQLQNGLAQLTSGTGQLAAGLAGGVGPAGELTTGLGTMQAAVVKARGQIPSTKDLAKLQRQSPGLFSSGYFVLAAVAGAPPSDRNASTFTINTFRGGTAAQIVVVSKYGASDPRTAALGSRLARAGQSFGVRNDAEVALGGPAGDLGDLTSVTKSHVWLDVIVLSGALTLLLGLAVRAVLLPIAATAFSLLATAASFGVLQLLFGGSDPPLGGPGYLDPMSIIGIFTVAFGVSATFAAVLLMRTREAYLARATGAVREGLRQTAAAATGAGLVMAAALVPFAATDLVNIRQFGIGVATAILLEVALVRPVLLPAAEAMLGSSGWWPTRTRRPSRPPTSTTKHVVLPRRPQHRRQSTSRSAR